MTNDDDNYAHSIRLTTSQVSRSILYMCALLHQLLSLPASWKWTSNSKTIHQLSTASATDSKNIIFPPGSLCSQPLGNINLINITNTLLYLLSITAIAWLCILNAMESWHLISEKLEARNEKHCLWLKRQGGGNAKKRNCIRTGCYSF